MVTSANSVARHSVIKTDICVIGSGPAGLSLALEFKDSTQKVCVLESGDLTPSDDAQSFSEVEATELPISPQSRVRVLGGTGTLWKGLWKPHDVIDFRPRPWVPHSGWPIARAALEPYYRRAAKLFHAPALTDYPATGELDGEKLTTSCLFRLAEKDFDLATGYRAVFEWAENITIYVNANVVALEKLGNGSAVKSAVVKTLDGNEFQVMANRFILACGGIENARLLLSSRLGNGNVGTCYMDHPKGVAGVLTTSKPVQWPAYWGTTQGSWWMKAGLRLSDAAQQREQVLNSFITLEPEFGKLGKIGKKYLGLVPATRTVRIRNYLEQAPVSSNRVTLSERKDRFGSPLAKVSWSISELDKKTMVTFHRLLRHEFSRCGIGEFRSPLLGNGQEFPTFTDASHHMGTTRMGSDPRNSVVDANCKLHDVDNVFIAGSSVFPTGGYANPNATIVALAIRLADHLKR